ncbi:extracellular solute-binding protein [Aeromicrobium alkaliterrae]|uniref:extracellular solute-binding protein n=1 Tax=Aeromicrobium alkaliterrae TaxID=302168 RepID=UPI0031D1905E
MTSRGRACVVAVTAGAIVMGSLASCAVGTSDADSGDPSTLRWYVQDAGSYAAIARACSDASEGAFRIELVEAPADPQERRTDLVQRLRTGDDLDLVGVDTSAIGELAAAELLAPVPGDLAGDLADGRTEPSVAAATVDGSLVAAPWWYEPQVLLHRGSVAERAGLDMTEAVTWDLLSAGASRVGGSVQVAGSTADWVRALVAGAADDPDLGVDALVSALDGPAGTAAASVVRTFAASSIGPGPSPDAAVTFAGPGGSFLVGPVSLVASDALAPVRAELRVAPYPLTSSTSTTSRSPLSGTALAVPASAADPETAFQAVTCLTAAPAQQTLVAATGHLPTLSDLLTSTAVAELVISPEVVASALADGAPEPAAPTTHLLEQAIDTTWAPLAAVGPDTPARSAAEARRLLDGGLS